MKLPIKGYEELYSITEYGCVFSHRRERWLAISSNGFGYNYVTLFKNRKGRQVSVHRLVASAFLPNPKKYPIVNHKDSNPQNNCVDNLEWCTQKHNMGHANSQGRMRWIRGEEHYNSKLSDVDVIEIRKLVGDGNSPYKIAPTYGIKPRQIYKIINREQRTNI